MKSVSLILKDIIVKTKLLLKGLLVVAFMAVFSAADAQITTWTFEPLQGAAATPTPNTGAGSSSIVPGATQSPGTATGMDPVTLGGCGTQNGSANGAWQFSNFNPGSATETNGVQFNASTASYSNITFSWDMRFSNTAPNTVRLQYTTDGTTWTNFVMTSGNTTICAGTSITSNGCFQTNTGDVYRRTTVNLSAITAANNNANFGVRLVAAFDPASGQFRQATTPSSVATNTGTWRFDNIIISGVLGTGPTNTVFNPAGTVAICPGSSTNLRFVVTGGTSPFTLIYKDNFGNNFTLNNYVSGTNVAVSPTVNTTYSLVSIANAGNGLAGVVSAASTRTVNISPQPALPLTLSAAPFTTYTVNDLTSCTASTALPANFPPATFTISGVNYTVVYTNTGTGTTFTFPYTGASMTFTVTIRNLTTTCTWTSPVCSFSRYTAPSVTTPPSSINQSTCSGTAFGALSVAATGSGLSYQWYSDDGATITSLVSAAEILRGSQTASYTPQSTTLGTLRYYVRISGYCSPAVNSAYSGNHTVNAAAVAGTVSAAQTICAGTSPSDLQLSGQTGSVIKWQRANDIGFTSGVADIATASATLTGTTIGNLNQTTYFIAYVQNGTCTVTTTPVQILIKSTTYSAGSWSNGTPDSTTTAIFADDYSSTANLNACSVEVVSGNVVFNAGDTLIIENGLTVSGGTLTFENEASLVQVNYALNTGNITYKRNTNPVRRFDYTYWSSPVGLQIMANMFSPAQQPMSDKYFWMNTATYQWQQVANPSITPMDIGKGYIIRAPQSFDPIATAVANATFIGVPNNGDYEVDIEKNGVNDLNCIGNPYPSAVNARKFIEENTGAFGSPAGTTLYFWTHNTPITNNVYTFSDYALYNLSGGTATGTPAAGSNSTTPDGYIAAGQSFMVRGVIEGTTSATFKNSMREIGNNDQFFKTTDDHQRNRIWLDLTNSQGLFKQLLVGYVANATDNFDHGYDGEIIEAGNAVSFYSILDNKKLGIQGKALPFELADEIPLGFNTANAGTYQVSLSAWDGIFENQAVYLEDRLLQIFHNLKDTPYSFVSESGTFDSRFVLRYADGNLTTSKDRLSQNYIVISKDENGAIIVRSNFEMDDVKVFDISGRILFEKAGIHTKEITLGQNWSSQVLLFQITSQDHKTATKKIVN
jgi:hypothetical protein